MGELVRGTDTPSERAKRRFVPPMPAIAAVAMLPGVATDGNILQLIKNGCNGFSHCTLNPSWEDMTGDSPAETVIEPSHPVCIAAYF